MPGGAGSGLPGARRGFAGRTRCPGPDYQGGAWSGFAGDDSAMILYQLSESVRFLLSFTLQRFPVSRIFNFHHYQAKPDRAYLIRPWLRRGRWRRDQENKTSVSDGQDFGKVEYTKLARWRRGPVVIKQEKLGSFFGIEVNTAEHRYHAEEKIEGRFGEQALRADLVDEAVLGENGQRAADQTEPE